MENKKTTKQLAKERLEYKGLTHDEWKAQVDGWDNPRENYQRISKLLDKDDRLIIPIAGKALLLPGSKTHNVRWRDGKRNLEEMSKKDMMRHIETLESALTDILVQFYWSGTPTQRGLRAFETALEVMQGLRENDFPFWLKDEEEAI